MTPPLPEASLNSTSHSSSSTALSLDAKSSSETTASSTTKAESSEDVAELEKAGTIRLKSRKASEPAGVSGSQEESSLSTAAPEDLDPPEAQPGDDPDLGVDGQSRREKRRKKGKKKTKIKDLVKDKGDSDSVESSGDAGDLTSGTSVGVEYEGVFCHRNFPYYRNKGPLSERIKTVPKRLEQYKNYVGLVEERLAWMEKRLTELEAKKPEEPPIPAEAATEPETTSSEPQRQPKVPKLNRVKWKEFKAPVISEKASSGEPEGVYAIDILVGEPLIYLESYAAKKRGVEKRLGELSGLEYPREPGPEPRLELDVEPDAGPVSKKTPTDGPEEPAQAQFPERIRINSIPVIKILEKLSSKEFSDPVKPLILFRPYRLLVYYEDDIRDWLRRLDNIWGPTEPTTETAVEGETTLPSDQREEDAEGDGSPDTRAQDPVHGESRKFEFPPDTGTEEAFNDLHCLIQFMDTYIRRRADYLGGNSFDKVFYSDIWNLFKPGDEVLGVVVRGTRQLYRVVQITGVRHHTSYANEVTSYWQRPATPVVIHCVYLDFDGRLLGPVRKRVTIPIFSGRRDIRSLPVYPVRFAPASDVLRQDLIKRGRFFMELAKVKHVQFRGITLDSQEEVDSQVVVDFEQTLQHNPSWEPQVDQPPSGDHTGPVPADEESFYCSVQGCCDNEIWVNDSYLDANRMKDFAQDHPEAVAYTRPMQAVREGGELRDGELVLLNHRLFAFVLRSRKWAIIDISDVREVVRNKDGEGFDLLVLPKGHKDMVRSLVKQHFREKNSTTVVEQEIDLVRGKGKGLIILLHGAPGVGKTSTAECVADAFNKPLFPITCGDLGVTASEVESKLETNFTLAHRWGCVLLLDEADIFLAERTKDDFLRNSLVSVFLRVLEYHAGILFLTTNRVGAFDEAFKSRIHISLYYPPLDKESTAEIWKMNIKRTKDRKRAAGLPFKIREKEIISYAEAHWDKNEEGRWNGRQIRNAFQTAIALADYEAQDGDSDNDTQQTSKRPLVTELRKKHFKIVAAASLDFDDYLKGVYGGVSQSERAYNLNARYDEFRREEAVAQYGDPRYLQPPSGYSPAQRLYGSIRPPNPVRAARPSRPKRERWREKPKQLSYSDSDSESEGSGSGKGPEPEAQDEEDSYDSCEEPEVPPPPRTKRRPAPREPKEPPVEVGRRRNRERK